MGPLTKIKAFEPGRSLPYSPRRYSLICYRICFSWVIIADFLGPSGLRFSFVWAEGQDGICLLENQLWKISRNNSCGPLTILLISDSLFVGQFLKDLPRKNKLSFESLCPGLLSLSLQEEIVCICIFFIYFAAANWNARRFSAIFYVQQVNRKYSFLI